MKRFCFIIILLTSLLFITMPASAQWDANTSMGDHALEVRGMGQQDDIQAIEDRKMIIMILGEDVKLVNKLKKSGDTLTLKEYRNAIDQLNHDFIAVVDSLWPFQQEFTYMIYDSVQTIPKEAKPEYAVMFFVRYQVYIESGETKTKTSYDINWDDYLITNEAYSEKNQSTVDFYTVFKIAKVEEFRRTPPVQLPMPHISPTKTDIAFGVSYAAWYMNQKMKGNADAELRAVLDENSRELSKLTLVICSDDVKKKMIDNPYDANYPYTFNVVPKEMYEQVIATKMQGYAYLIMNCGKPCVIRAEDAEPLYISRLYDWNALISFKQMGKEVAKITGKGK